MPDLGFIAGGPLVPSLRQARTGRAAVQLSPVCMGRRSDKIKNKKEKNTRARTKVLILRSCIVFREPSCYRSCSCALLVG